jgi:hypothetical protein
MILQYSIIIFITQLVFIGCRTWNVKAIAKQDIPQVLISGTFVHLSWLVSISIGAVSMHEIISNFELQYIPIVLCSLSGGLIGSYLSMKSKRF